MATKLDLDSLNKALSSANQATAAANKAAANATAVANGVTGGSLTPSSATYGSSTSTTNSSTRGGSSSKTTSGSTSTTTQKSTYDKYKDYQKSQTVNEAKAALDSWLGRQPGEYTQGEKVTQAREALDEWLNKQPGAYESKYQTQIDDLMNRILNRDSFSYDFNSDPMYHQYAERYQEQGRQAMIDTTAQAAALTGGYGSSYAATAGSQAYQQNLQQLNDIIPQLYQLALERYNTEGDTLRDNLGALEAEENRNYGQYRDSVADWENQRDYLQGEYWQNQSFDYQQYRDSVTDWADMRDFLAKQYGDEYARDFEKWYSEIQLGGQTNTSTTNTSGWSNTEESNWSDTTSTTRTNSTSYNYSTPTTTTKSGGSSGSAGSAGKVSDGTLKAMSAEMAKWRGWDTGKGTTANVVDYLGSKGYEPEEIYAYLQKYPIK